MQDTVSAKWFKNNEARVYNFTTEEVNLMFFINTIDKDILDRVIAANSTDALENELRRYVRA